ncbi:metal ABC transporter ATP-binding protein [Methanoregula sp.]|jgi:zinc/manganese transport system ATP-binding protein|uniref:metal ABC transporter ATP-binding protein n=1 Tax=Methanoregula sp. TaxID=2052170 RepID=UPI003C15B82E
MTKNFPPIITAENLTVGYQENIVWQDANFTIEHGEFVAIIGPNGSGKTTLFRLLLGLQQPLQGTIKVFDAWPKRGNQHIGYIPQRHVIDEETNLESLELVRLGFSGNKWGLNPFSNDDRNAAYDALKSVGAEELTRRSLGRLSGGELQRVFLAEALVSEPHLLLLDEPLSNLDIRREQELVQVIHNVVRSRNVTALLIAHNINPLLPVLDKVIYIANGKVAIGKPDEVLTSEALSALYGIQVEVLRGSQGQIAVIGTEENQHHYP